MTHTDLRRFVSSFAAAAVLLLQITPALADADGADRVAAQGARYPGLPVHADNARKMDSRTIKVTFTKWVTMDFDMAGNTGGGVPGVFAGEVLQRVVTTNPNIVPIIALEAVYEVQADNARHSFTALLRGGQTGDTPGRLGSAILNGVILAGWRTGGHVRVEFQKISTCSGKPAGPCFQGTMYIEAPKK